MYSLPLKNTGVGGTDTPPNCRKSAYNLTPQNLTTNSLLLTGGSLTNNIDNTHFLDMSYVLCSYNKVSWKNDVIKIIRKIHL